MNTSPPPPSFANDYLQSFLYILCYRRLISSENHWWQTPVILELPSFILLNEPHAKGRLSVWPLKYWTTASPELFAAVVTWIIRPFCLLQWNLSWVKDKCVLSSFMAFSVMNNVLFQWQLLISRYDDAIQSCREDGSSTTTLETRSQPPVQNEANINQHN